MNRNDLPTQAARSERPELDEWPDAQEADNDPWSGDTTRPVAAEPVWLSSFLGRHFAKPAAEGAVKALPAREADPARGLTEAARSYRQFRLHHETPDSAQVEAWLTSYEGNPTHANLFWDLHRADPQSARRMAEAMAAWPEPGCEFLGFRLLALLGRGAFGRVFLAQQGDLANRPVALKVSTELVNESQTLAQLHHPHIVPIYSRRKARGFSRH